MTYYRRRHLDQEEELFAVSIGAAVGAIAFYLARIWLQRERLEEGPPRQQAPELEDEGVSRLSR